MATSNLNLRISGLIPDSVVDGPGIRYTIFTQGCPHKCKDCHNPSTWSTTGGQLMPISEILADIYDMEYVKGVTFSGGEPFVQTEALIAIAKELKSRDYHLLSFSGYIYEEILKDASKREFLSYLDILIDGKFDINKKDPKLLFRGSSNQRVIDVQQSLLSNEIILALE